MSAQLGKVLSLILCERFGPVVEKVGTYLFQYGTTPLLYIKRNTELPLSKVKESLCILIKYRLVSFVPNKNENVANYSLDAEKVLLMLRYPKYINLIKKKFGDESEMIIEEILQRSYWTASELILKVHERLSKNTENTVPLLELKEKFISLVTAKYLIRLPYSEGDKPIPDLKINDKELHLVPNIDIKQLINAKSSTVHDFLDRNIYWTVNFDRFHQDMRDKIIVTAFTIKFDENAGEFVKLLLQQMYIRTEPWADVSNPVPILEIKDLLKKQTREASGGSFQIYLKEAFTQFAWEIVEQCVLEKFDSKAARIFRLVKLKKYIESDQIQQLAMIPAKEAKRLSYQLLEENFLKNPRT
ncbi:hypothetical protein NQ314_001785 [Rhamnusium bicolor]|uniref:DNA-directed RNA polymerase III subunit RPC3 n=1 Tax=Rhamnusium bicolor TaxID=1586634 RepID=A0AAV8ZT26_9CUCU|nr:hypothetical protein NQ314_001785 [Rhamnusium bicolor]